MSPAPTLGTIFLAALRLGCTSFGGPVAHLAFFRHEYVARRRWLDEAQYADVVALCQFLPGPASSQVGFAVGFLQRGLAGGLAAWLGFTLPSAVLMIALAYGISSFVELAGAGWLKGLKAAAVAVVAQAVWSMWRTLCPDWKRSALAGAAAGAVFLLPQTGAPLGAIGTGALVGWCFLKFSGGGTTGPASIAQSAGPMVPPPRQGMPYLVACTILFFALPALVRSTNIPLLEIADKFYRTGALVFGGGHVVLPLLEREVVANGAVSHDQFLAGYGLVQAAPGPLFTFSGYLGTLMLPAGSARWLGGLVGIAAIFLPGLLLVAGTLPFWQTLRRRPGAAAALRGANAAVVGILLAALWHPVGTAGIVDWPSALLALGAFAALLSGRVPVWAVIILAAVAGAAIW